jgi:hypothetical protein
VTTVRVTITSPYIAGGWVQVETDAMADAERLAAALTRWGCKVTTGLVTEEVEPYDWTEDPLTNSVMPE